MLRLTKTTSPYAGHGLDQDQRLVTRLDEAKQALEAYREVEPDENPRADLLARARG